MEIFKLFGTILVKDEKALKSLKSVDKTAQNTSKKMSSAFKKIGVALVTYFAVDKIKQFGQACVEAWDIQKEAELKLETVMKERMNATDKEIQGIKDLASAQQALGVVGDEVQLSGAQQLATFLSTDSALQSLLPAMNNLAVQQNGVNVSTGNMVQIGNAFGKVMMGQTGALKKMGITFDENQEKVLKYGTEQEKAAMLAKIVTENVGNMNAEFAKTDAGKIQQAKNNFGDLQEMIGKYLQPVIAAFYDKMNDVTVWLMDNLPPAIQTCQDAVNNLKDKWEEFKCKIQEGKTWIDNNKTAIELLAVAFGTLGLAILAYNTSSIIAMASSVAETVAIYGLIVAETIATGATTLLAGATSVLGAVIGFLTSPITLVIVAIGLLVAAGILLCKNWDTVKAKAMELKDQVINKFNELKTQAIDKVTSLVSPIVDKFNSIKTQGINKFNELKTQSINKFNELKTQAINKVTSLVSPIIDKFNSIKTGITNAINTAKDAVRNAIDKIKGFFNFSWKLPHIKLPHFSVSGSANPIDWLSQGVPKVSIKWYAKGGIMTQPTLFGGGEAGPEAILPLNNFYKHLDNKLNDNKNNIDYDRMAKCMVKAVSNMAVIMDSKPVGKMTFRTVNDETNKDKIRMNRLAGVVDV